MAHMYPPPHALHLSLMCLPLCLRPCVFALMCVGPQIRAGSPTCMPPPPPKKMKKLRSLCNAGGTDHGVAPQLTWLGRGREGKGGREGGRGGGREGEREGERERGREVRIRARLDSSSALVHCSSLLVRVLSHALVLWRYTHMFRYIYPPPHMTHIHTHVPIHVSSSSYDTHTHTCADTCILLLI